MEHNVFSFCLKILRKFSTYLQIGNPSQKAPALTLKPRDEERLFNQVGGVNNLSVWQLRQVICSGLYGGAVINEHNQVYSRFTSFPWGNDLHLSISLPYLGRKYSTLGKAIFLITPEAKGNYYHWITDLLPRILLIKKCNLADFHERWIILHHPPKPYEVDTLHFLDIKKDKIIRLRPFEYNIVQDLIIADCNFPKGFFPLWKKELLDEFKKGFSEKNKYTDCKKIYLLRGKQKKRRLIGEDHLVNLLKQQNFHIYDPQEMTLSEQIKVLEGADVVVALHGAALTNIIFCKEQTLIIELRSKTNPPECYSNIAKTYNLRMETVILPPEHTFDQYHLSNKQNLILRQKEIGILMSKLQITL